jgi:hypothetical protein
MKCQSSRLRAGTWPGAFHDDFSARLLDDFGPFQCGVPPLRAAEPGNKAKAGKLTSPGVKKSKKPSELVLVDLVF